MEEPTLSMSRPWQGDGPELRTWGPFDLLERVGRGGFGEVYRAFDPALQREVAVKLLLPDSGGGDEQGDAILREARAMARIIHPNVVPIYGVGVYDGRAGFWSAFIHGRTLSALLAANGPFGPGEVIHIGSGSLPRSERRPCRRSAAPRHQGGQRHARGGRAYRSDGLRPDA